MFEPGGDEGELALQRDCPRCGLHWAWQDFSQGENQITSLTSLAIAAWRLTVNAPFERGRGGDARWPARWHRMTIEPTDIVEQGCPRCSGSAGGSAGPRPVACRWPPPHHRPHRSAPVGEFKPDVCQKASFGSLARSKPHPAPPGIWLVALREIPSHTAGDYLAAI